MSSRSTRGETRRNSAPCARCCAHPDSAPDEPGNCSKNTAAPRPSSQRCTGRLPPPTGREIAGEFAAFLAGAGLVVTSGLALGIDGAAHSGALEAGGGTVAVMGAGPDRIYPQRHLELAERISASGALATEFPPGTPPLAEHFPRRNRIISGLSLATLVVEAAFGSGSLITARLAAEQGREVFAVPGSIRSPLAHGCHALIREGAGLVERPSDMLEALGSVPLPVSTFAEAGAEGAAEESDPNYRFFSTRSAFTQ